MSATSRLVHHGVIAMARWARAGGGPAPLPARNHACPDELIAPSPTTSRLSLARRGRKDGPLADRRGARGRAVAIRNAILAARRDGSNIEEALERAISAGIPPHAKNASSD